MLTLNYARCSELRDRERTEFGKWLKSAREGRGLTMRGLAEAMGLSHAHISKLESGAANPSRAVVHQIARELSSEATYASTLSTALRSAGFASTEPVGVEMVALSPSERAIIEQIRAMAGAPAPPPPPATDDTRTAGERKQGVPAMADRTLPPKTRRERDF